MMPLNHIQQGRTPARILAILEIDNSWMSAHELVADLTLRWDPVKLTSVRQAMGRLSLSGRVEQRLVPVYPENIRDCEMEQIEVRLA